MLRTEAYTVLVILRSAATKNLFLIFHRDKGRSFAELVLSEAKDLC